MRKRNIRQFLTKPQARWESTAISITFTMSRGTAAQLQEIAAVENTPLQELLTVAIDEWLARRSDASISKARKTACS
jgi:hypothetical protein